MALGGLRAVSIGALRDADGASVVVAAGQDGRLHAASARAGRHGEADRRSGAGDLRWTRASSMAGACGERRVLVLGSDGRVSTKVSRGGAWGGWAAVGAQRFATGASLAALDIPGEWFLSLPAHCFAEAE